MNDLRRLSLWLGLVCLAIAASGCRNDSGNHTSGDGGGNAATETSRVATADATDVQAAKDLLNRIGGSYRIVPDGVLLEISLKDASVLTRKDVELFGRLTDLESLQILNYRALDDESARQLSGLKKLKTLALTNSVIGDATVEMIVESFPGLKTLDLSSNTNMTNDAMQIICRLEDLERLSLVQNRFNDLGTLHLPKLKKLRFLDLRGNMEAGDMTLDSVSELPALEVFKHRSTTVTDMGVADLARSKTLRALLMQDFNITSQAGESLAQIPNLRELEIFRCPAFGSEGVLALKGRPLTRLQLRDMPMVDDQAMAVFEDLPQLKKLYLHENDSISDSGLASLVNLKQLEVIDLWTLPQVSDGTIEVLAGLPNLRELSVRVTGVTDAAVETIMGMKKLKKLTFTDNASVSGDAVKKLATRKDWKLDLGK